MKRITPSYNSSNENPFLFIFNFIKKYIWALLGICFGLFIALVIIIYSDFKKVKELTNFKPNITTKIYDKNNQLITKLFKQKREVVPFKKFPKDLINSFIAMEDNEFYSHYGVNPKGIVRAFFVNLLAGRVKQGGSTITQQLAKILLTSRKRNIYRKIKEAFIALMIEMEYPKDKILELYLNQIYLGHGAYGVESASQLYFKKSVSELNLAQCALLATLPSAPNRLSPIKNLTGSMRMHKMALAKMVDLGFISIADAEKAYNDFWRDYSYELSDRSPSLTVWSIRDDKAPWFTEYIRRILIKKYGEEAVYNEGLKVYTTLDLKKQKYAQEIVEDKLRKQSKISSSLSFKNEDYVIESFSSTLDLLTLVLGYPPVGRKGSLLDKKINDKFKNTVLDQLQILNLMNGQDLIEDFLTKYREETLNDKYFQQVQGALITINHNNGYIEAMVGGNKFSSINQLNRVIQSRRQPGSSIKPLLYTAAIESKKFTTATTILDSPTIFLDNEGGDWIPENYEGEFFGLLRLRKALAKSVNVVSIKIAEVLGIDVVLDYFAKLLRFDKDEAKKRIPRNFSIVLGSVEVSPMELAHAYAIIASGGNDVIPFAIRKVEDRNGKILENQEKEIEDEIEKRKKDGTLRIIEPETAQVMIDLMQTVVSSGTGLAASANRPTAGKTGTTNSWKDAWFVGFTPEVTTCLWVGYDALGLSLGPGQTGGNVAAPIWGEYMRAAFNGVPVKNFPVYANLVRANVCSVSGLLPSSNCQVITEVFIPGTVPVDTCDRCENMSSEYELSNKGPKKNIAQKQKEQILKSLKKNKVKDDILNNIGDDLLD